MQILRETYCDSEFRCQLLRLGASGSWLTGGEISTTAPTKQSRAGRVAPVTKKTQRQFK